MFSNFLCLQILHIIQVVCTLAGSLVQLEHLGKFVTELANLSFLINEVNHEQFPHLSDPG